MAAPKSPIRKSLTRKPPTGSRKRRSQGAETYLGEFAKKLGKTEALRRGSIVLRLTGAGGGEYCLDCSTKGIRLSKGMPRSAPLIEVMGDARRIRGILEGKKNGRTQFLAGGIRVRGDLRYLSDLALELGIIKQPI